TRSPCGETVNENEFEAPDKPLRLWPVHTAPLALVKAIVPVQVPARDDCDGCAGFDPQPANVLTSTIHDATSPSFMNVVPTINSSVAPASHDCTQSTRSPIDDNCKRAWNVV